MRVFLTGGTGFIGRHLVRALLERGDECVVVSRSGRNPWNDSRASVVLGDPTEEGEWQRRVGEADAVINLAGERIIDPPHRWTAERKRRLKVSRVSVTRNVVAALRNGDRQTRLLLSGSAIGYYGPRGDETLDESASAGSDFLATLAVEWEESARQAEDVVPVGLLRTGIVLGSDGGALEPLLTLFRTGLGGPWGNGRQWWSWIHIADQVGLILLALDRALSGPINLTAPNPVTVNAFAKALGAALRRPSIFRAPEFVLRSVLGESAAALFDLQRVVPTRALELGYAFRFPEVSEALADLLQ